MATTSENESSVDIVVITIREDEHDAVLKRIGHHKPLPEGERTYALSTVRNRHGTDYRVAIVRTLEKGAEAAQETTRDAIESLAPSWILLVGIAGGIPDSDFTLGDVVVATRIHAFTTAAAYESRFPEFGNQGGPMHKKVSDLVAYLPAMQETLAGWNKDSSINYPRPTVNLRENNIYGNKQWRQKVRDSIGHHFGSSPRDYPIVVGREIATSGFLVKKTSLAKQWQKSARDVMAVEMELGGVYRAARRLHKEYPVLAIRGISDIVGFKRDPKWTPYACETAASFCIALLRNIPAHYISNSVTQYASEITKTEGPIEPMTAKIAERRDARPQSNSDANGLESQTIAAPAILSRHPAPSDSIPELEDLERIEQIERRHKREHGSELINLSHWNPSSDFKGRLEPILKVPRSTKFIDYEYTYYLEDRHEVLTRMGYNDRDVECLFTPSGTISVVCAVNWLKLKKVRNVAILAPFYFTMAHICRQFEIPVLPGFLRRRDGEYTLPQDVLDPSRTSALWITNPAYSTSVHMVDKEIARLRQYMNGGGIIVLDESLAITADALGPKLGDHTNFLGIHSPHKSVSINSLKFSALVFSRRELDSFEQWSDVFSGGLPASSVVAIRHFCSANFQQYEAEFLRQTGRVFKKVTKILSEHHGADLDKRVRGNFITCYYPDIKYEAGRDETFMDWITRASGATFIPSSRNHTDPAWGFGFRINLARENDAFYRVLRRLARNLEMHLQQQSSNPS